MQVRDQIEEISHLPFANDTMLFGEPEKRALLNVRCMLRGC